MQEQEKRGPGRPTFESRGIPTEPKREVHLYIPESLAKKADLRRGNVAISAYIRQLIEDDIRFGKNMSRS